LKFLRAVKRILGYIKDFCIHSWIYDKPTQTYPTIVQNKICCKCHRLRTELRKKEHKQDTEIPFDEYLYSAVEDQLYYLYKDQQCKVVEKDEYEDDEVFIEEEEKEDGSSEES
jgi:hypothetical protein